MPRYVVHRTSIALFQLKMNKVSRLITAAAKNASVFLRQHFMKESFRYGKITLDEKINLKPVCKFVNLHITQLLLLNDVKML